MISSVLPLFPQSAIEDVLGSFVGIDVLDGNDVVLP